MVVVGKSEPRRRRQLGDLTQMHVGLLRCLLRGHHDLAARGSNLLRGFLTGEVLKHQDVLEGVVAPSGVHDVTCALVIDRHSQSDLVFCEAVEQISVRAMANVGRDIEAVIQERVGLRRQRIIFERALERVCLNYFGPLLQGQKLPVADLAA